MSAARGNAAVGWSAVSHGRRSCVFCGGPANSREHVFKKDFKKKLGITDPLDRAFTQRDGNGVVTRRPDPLFESKVRRVCKQCNNTWMNHLDLHVEHWILDPDDRAAYEGCDPTQFRRWAIKLALMRSLLDTATFVPREYFQDLFQGHDIEDWHVFVGRASFKEYRHAFSHFGVGLDAAARNMTHGLIHASWALGTAVVSAACVRGLNPKTDFFPDFRRYNRMMKEPLVEIPYGAAAMPDVFGHRKLGAFQTEPFFMFYTLEPVSPYAAEMKKTYDMIHALARSYGLPSTT
ncbi:hypothetical protein [Mycobacterium seoulense]|uniref:hypothetical protein n=1 Tax=Mycobacterium seoulense TaxID=386911 RepID=UPI003CEBE9DC